MWHERMHGKMSNKRVNAWRFKVGRPCRWRRVTWRSMQDGGKRLKTWVRFTFGRTGRRDFPDAGSKFWQSAWLIDNPLTRHCSEEKGKKVACRKCTVRWMSSMIIFRLVGTKRKWLGNFALLILQFIVAKHNAENIYVYKDIQPLQVSECSSNF